MSKNKDVAVMVTGIIRNNKVKDNKVALSVKTDKGQNLHLILSVKELSYINAESWRLLNVLNSDKLKSPDTMNNVLLPHFEDISVFFSQNKISNKKQALILGKTPDGQEAFFPIPNHLLDDVIKGLQKVKKCSEEEAKKSSPELRIVH